MASHSKSDIIRRCFDAYRLKDRSILEDLFTESFRFTSPYDDGIDRPTYFERCWPNNDRIEKNSLEQIFEDGDARLRDLQMPHQ